MGLFFTASRGIGHAKLSAVSRSASAKLASAVIETLEERRLLSSGPAVVGFQAANLTTHGQNTIVVDVTYASPAGIDDTTFEDSNLDVADAAGEDLPVTYASDTVNADGSITAEYDVQKDYSGHIFNASDNGTYIVNVQDSEVADLDGNYVPAGEAGSFDINISGPVVPPTATLQSIATVTAPATTDVLVNVTYNSAIGIDETSFDDTNITVTAPDGVTTLNTSFVSSTDNADGSVTATYDVSQPNHVQFTNANNGTYTISTNSDEVVDNEGTQVVAGNIGTFNVNVAATPTGTGPTATLQANNLTGNSYLADEQFTVTYQDSAEIATNTLDSDDILVTGPNGFSRTANFDSFVTNSDGSVTATYDVYVGGAISVGPVSPIGGPVSPIPGPVLPIDPGGPMDPVGGAPVPQVSSVPNIPAGSTGSTTGGSTTGTPVIPIIGGFGGGGNGTYTVTLQANQVSDVNGITAASATLGTFNVNLTPSPTPTPLPFNPGGPIQDPIPVVTSGRSSPTSGADAPTARQLHAAHKAHSLRHRHKKHHKA